MIPAQPYFPAVDLSYEPCVPGPRDFEESYPAGFFSRMMTTAAAIESRFFGSGNTGEHVLLGTHAACAVALTAALLRVPVESVPRAGACSLYQLVRQRDSWELVLSADTGYLPPALLSQHTVPWGYDDKPSDCALWDLDQMPTMIAGAKL